MPGEYQLEITLNGCSSPVSTETIIINDSPAIPLAVSDTLICEGQDLILTISNPIAGATYEWFSEDNGNVSIGFGEELIIPGATIDDSGSYYVLITINGCSFDPTINNTVEAYTNVEVISQNIILAQADIDTIICDDNYLLLANEVPSPLDLITNTTWTIGNGGSAILDAPLENITMATNLQMVENIFIWSINNNTCGNIFFRFHDCHF